MAIDDDAEEQIKAAEQTLYKLGEQGVDLLRQLGSVRGADAEDELDLLRQLQGGLERLALQVQAGEDAPVVLGG